MHTKIFPWRGQFRQVDWEGGKARADKSIPQGGTYLLEKEAWGSLIEIQGHDPDVLFSEVMEEAFQQILLKHRRGRPIALFSLCTATRPYSLSKKWAQYIKLFEKNCDLIIHSNGGIIPIEFEGQYPYLNYDAHGERRFDNDYIEVGIRRLKEFLTKHPYRFILFNYRHNMRNVYIAREVGPWAVANGLCEEYAISPTEDDYKVAQAEDFVQAGFKMFPEMWPSVLDKLDQQIKKWEQRL